MRDPWLRKMLAPTAEQLHAERAAKARREAALPESYRAAKDALRACAKQFTPERYAVASFALERCAEHDELERDGISLSIS